jgi:hypothetical protein
MYGITFFLKKRNEGALEDLDYVKSFTQNLEGGPRLKSKILKELNLLSKFLLTRSRTEYEERIHRYNMIDGK